MFTDRPPLYSHVLVEQRQFPMQKPQSQGAFEWNYHRTTRIVTQENLLQCLHRLQTTNHVVHKSLLEANEQSSISTIGTVADDILSTVPQSFLRILIREEKPSKMRSKHQSSQPYSQHAIYPTCFSRRWLLELKPTASSEIPSPPARLHLP